MSTSETIEVSSKMEEEAIEQIQTGSGTDTDRVEGANEKDTEGHPKEVDEKIEEEIKWPCGVCEESVSVDGLECVACKKWYHFGDCTDNISSNEYTTKPYTCPKCLEKGGDKAKKPKDNLKGKQKVGRPRRHSIPTYLTEGD